MSNGAVECHRLAWQAVLRPGDLTEFGIQRQVGPITTPSDPKRLTCFVMHYISIWRTQPFNLIGKVDSRLLSNLMDTVFQPLTDNRHSNWHWPKCCSHHIETMCIWIFADCRYAKREISQTWFQWRRRTLQRCNLRDLKTWHCRNWCHLVLQHTNPFPNLPNLTH
jgi:hypothetical protein